MLQSTGTIWIVFWVHVFYLFFKKDVLLEISRDRKLERRIAKRQTRLAYWLSSFNG